MQLTSLGKSKLARSFALLFICCAILPTLALLYLSYHRVSSEMVEQAKIRLTKDTKSYGMSLLDRMVRMRDHLAFMAENIGADGRLTEMVAHETGELFDSLTLLNANGPSSFLLGDGGSVARLFTGYPRQGESNLVAVVSEPVAGGAARIYLLFPLRIQKGIQGVLVGEANLDYLWGTGASPLLSDSTNLAVYDGSGEALFTTAISPGRTISGYRDKDANQFRRFVYFYDGQRYLAGAWDLFLKSKFDGDTWIIVLSQREDEILASLGRFQRNLIAVVCLGLLVVLLLTMFFIRKRLEPLDALKKRTEQIALKDFTTEVVVKSGDEFEALAGSFNSMSRELKKQFSALETIDFIDRAILSSLSLSEMINTALPMIRNFFQCDTIVMGSFRDESGGECTGYAYTGRMMSPVTENFTMDRERLKTIFQQSEPYFWLAEERPFVDIPSLSPEDHQTILSLPLKNDNVSIGILILGYRRERIYDDGELKQLRQFADQVSIALSNAALVQNLENLATGTIEALARTVDAKSKWTAGHSERVAGYACHIAAVMGLGDKDLALVHRGGLLHDIGKIGTPIAILDKEARLDDQEYWEIRKHPQIGATIIEPVSVHRDIMHIILEHHERFDGKGYPRGLAAEEISLHGRITAVADVFDALSSARPYRNSWTPNNVREYIRKKSGTHFDPVVVTAFEKTLASGLIDVSHADYEYNFSVA